VSPFTPSGDRARWRVLYELLRKRDIGDVLAYEEMGAALQLDPVAERSTIQLAFRRAAKEFLEQNRRATDTIPNIGYRIVEPAEQLGLAQRHQRRAGRAIASARTVLAKVDWELIADPEARRALELAGTLINRQQEMMARMDIRQRRLEEAMDAVVVRSDRADAEMDELRARLSRLERGT
jgi:hypothetical protein